MATPTPPASAPQPGPGQPRFRWLPAPNTRNYHLLLGGVAMLILGPLGGVTSAYMFFTPRVRGGRPGAGRHPRLGGDVRLRPRGQARRQLHPDAGGVGRVDGGHVRADPGDGLAGHADARDLEADALLRLHRHVRHRRRDAVHADPGRPAAARVPVGPRGREHPARADRPEAAATIDRAGWAAAPAPGCSSPASPRA